MPTPPRVSLLVIRSADPDRASQFYSSLGFEFVKHSHGSGPEHFASDHAGFVFEIYPLQDHPPTTSTRIGFTVTSVDAAVEALQKNGGTLVSKPKDSRWGRRAVMDDLDGHRFELVEPQAKQ